MQQIWFKFIGYVLPSSNIMTSVLFAFNFIHPSYYTANSLLLRSNDMKDRQGVTVLIFCQIIQIDFHFIFFKVTDESNLNQKKVIVVFGKHTRRVNIPAGRGNEWMNSLKLTVVKNFLDVLSPNGNETETAFEKVKDGILLQVYDQSFDAFVDMTDAEVLPENAKLKLEVISNRYEGTGGKALLKEHAKTSKVNLRKINFD